MFILSAGMPKSGSTLFSFYQKEVVESVFSCNGQKYFEDFIKEGILNGIGHFIHDVDSANTLQSLVSLSQKFGPFVVKSHCVLTPDIQNYIQKNQILATYIHRDPRDVILSAIDHGHRVIGGGISKSYFQEFNTIESSIPLVKEFCRVGFDWITSGLGEIFRYFDLVADPKAHITRFFRLLGAVPDDQLMNRMIEKYTVNQIPGVRQFNYGKATRFRKEMTIEEIEACTNELHEEIVRLGYNL